MECRLICGCTNTGRQHALHLFTVCTSLQSLHVLNVLIVVQYEMNRLDLNNVLLLHKSRIINGILQVDTIRGLTRNTKLYMHMYVHVMSTSDTSGQWRVFSLYQLNVCADVCCGICVSVFQTSTLMCLLWDLCI